MTSFKLLISTALACIVTVVSSQSLQQKNLFSLGGDPHTLEEFEYYFLKNNKRPTSSEAKDQVRQYLSLYVDFRLKIKEAYNQELDKERKFISELKGYDEQLIEPYLTTSKVTDDLVREAYNRLQYEISGSHILVSHPKSNLPEDTLAAYNKLLTYKKRIESGEDFGDIAAKYSDDRSAINNKGNLGYFTAMQMVYPFENAAYNSKVGDMVGPFRTRFGYHLLRIEDRRKAMGNVSCAHIMIRFEQEDSVAMKKAHSKALTIYQNLLDGKNWDELCKLYSDDKNTAGKGGQLRWFGTGQLVPSFEEAALAMNKIDSISEPVKTRFAWHIIKLLDKKELESFEDMKAEIKNRISRDTRTSRKKTEALKALKDKLLYKSYKDGKNKALSVIDSTLLMANWKTPSAKINFANDPLFELDRSIVEVKDFWQYVLENQRSRKTADLQSYVELLYNRFEEKSIFDFERESIRSSNREYKMIYEEYKNGIMLFNLMERKVWNKAVEDSIGLKTYFEANRKSYPTPERLEVRKFVLSEPSLLDSVKSSLNLSIAELDSIFNKENTLTLHATQELITKGEQVALDKNWRIGLVEESGDDHLTIWQVQKIIPPGLKSLDEVKGMVISDYQTELESAWLRELKKKYPVKINKSALKTYIQSF